MAGLNLFTNNASTTLASGISAVATSLTVNSSTGGLFPNPTAGQYFYCTLSNTSATIIEIVKVTARSTDTFTIVRGQDNTTASAFSAADKVELRLTNSDLINFPQLDSTNTFALAQTFTTAIAVTSGGTGVTTSTGSGNNVLSISPALTTPNLGIPSAGTLTSCTGLPLTTGVTGTLPLANGGTGATTLAAATIATLGYTTTATAVGTTTLTVSSTATQFFTGVTTQTVVLPVTSTLTQGQQFTIHNNSTGDVAIQSSGLNAVITVTSNTTAVCTCILTSGTTAASWDADLTGFTTSLPVARGGTGATSATAYAVQCGGTTSTGAHQSIASVGTTGQILTSNGAGALPTFQTAASGGGGLGGITVFTANGTFTIPSGKTVLKVTVIGGGGGAGGNPGYTGSTGGAGAGGTAIKYLTAVTAGNTLTVTRGAGGSGAIANGSAGATSSVSSGTQVITTISATGGSGSVGINNTPQTNIGAAGGVGSSGDLNITGGAGEHSNVRTPGGCCAPEYYGGLGGASFLSGSGLGGSSANTYGGGGPGKNNGYGAGATGANGVIIFEY